MFLDLSNRLAETEGCEGQDEFSNSWTNNWILNQVSSELLENVGMINRATTSLARPCPSPLFWAMTTPSRGGPGLCDFVV